jgi:hypothetical protein
MRKLGMASRVHIEVEDFDRYLNAFMDGLSIEQVHLIKELFKDRAFVLIASLEAEEVDSTLPAVARPPSVLMETENIIIWNVRGLNAWSHHDAVRELVRAERPSIVCLQETKLSVILDFDLI